MAWAIEQREIEVPKLVLTIRPKSSSRKDNDRNTQLFELK